MCVEVVSPWRLADSVMDGIRAEGARGVWNAAIERVIDMKKLGYLRSSGLSLCFPGASLAGFAQGPAPPAGYVLQWTDDFSGPALDTSKWNYRVDAKDFTAQRPQNVSLDGKGHLDIDLRQEEYGGKHFTAGGVVSTANFRYGYYEVLAKTTHYPGWHTAFWMLAGDGRLIPPRFPAVSNTWTEIDDFEIEDPRVISMGILEWQHGQNSGSTRCDQHFVPGFDTAAAYHSYGLEWTEEQITYYLDGKAVCKQAYPPTQSPHDRLNIWLTSIAHKSGVPYTDKSVPSDIGLAVGSEPSPASFGRVAYYIRDYYIRDLEPGYAEYGPGWTDGMLPGYSDWGRAFPAPPAQSLYGRRRSFNRDGSISRFIACRTRNMILQRPSRSIRGRVIARRRLILRAEMKAGAISGTSSWIQVQLIL